MLLYLVLTVCSYLSLGLSALDCSPTDLDCSFWLDLALIEFEFDGGIMLVVP